ncbi:MAG: 2-dehydro-3-deoxygalactonokinase [Bacteroidota bacterium]
MEKFLACDWGTTHFRLRLVDGNTCIVLAEEKNQKGISETYSLWRQTNTRIETRPAFYLSIINEAIRKFEKEIGLSLDHIPVVISGMASASIGMLELPYARLPFLIDGSGLVVQTVSSTSDFQHPVFMISGARDENDVMRGEETQLIGASQFSSAEEQLYIFPGTHSKHIKVKNRSAFTVKTYMTGEFFELLSKKSILSHSIEEDKDLEELSNKLSFEKGVASGLSSDLLHNAFLVRTNDLFKTATKQENYYFLSGLLIGTELSGLRNGDFPLITLVSNEAMFDLYSLALQIAGINNIQFCNADEAIIKGQSIILRQLTDRK